MGTHRTWAMRAAAIMAAFSLTGALAACGGSPAADDGAHAQEAVASQSPQATQDTEPQDDARDEAQSLASTMLFNGPSHTDTAMPGAWGESGCDAQKQARIIVVRGTEEPAGQSLMNPLASRIAAELGDHAQISDLDYPASWESGSEAVGVNRLIAVLNAQSAQCPAMRTVLLGYSQGAMVVGDALSAPDARFNEDNGYELSPVAHGHIVAVELYGDPRFSAGASYNSGDFDRAVNGILGARGAADFGEIADRTISFCTARDFACQTGGDTEPHGSYATNGMLDEGAKYAVERVKATF